MSRSNVTSAEPCAVAAIPPTMTKATLLSARSAITFCRSITGESRGAAYLFQAFHDALQVSQPFLGAELQALDEQRQVDAEIARRGNGAARLGRTQPLDCFSHSDASVAYPPRQLHREECAECPLLTLPNPQ